MAYTDIDKPTDYFNTVLYTGNGSSQTITGVGFAGDWFWFKERSTSGNHQQLDRVRSSFTKNLTSNRTNAEGTTSTYITSVNSDGFAVGTNNGINQSGVTNVAWCWLADNTTGSSNSNGSITSTVSANTTSGFSIVAFAGTGSNATVGHGLSSAPKMIIVKNRDAGDSWIVGHDSIGFTKFTKLDEDGGSGDSSGFFNNTAPTSSVFSVGNQDDVNASSENIIAYCFAEKKGFSKFGSYKGNGNSDGTFVYTGFKPAYVMQKASSRSGSWAIYDNGRNPFNGAGRRLFANNTDTESDGEVTDFLSNGFKIRNTGSGQNQNADTYIYMAFAESPFVTSTGIPTTAR